MTKHRWTKEDVIAAIRKEHEAGHDLGYMATLKRTRVLLRAAERAFGRWSDAIEATGLDYESFRKNRVWTREAVIDKIKWWHEQGQDLSVRFVAYELDPPLVAAALHADRFPSWNDALRAAGLDPEMIARAARWSPERIAREVHALTSAGVQLKYAVLSKTAPRLLMAIYRHTGSLKAVRQSCVHDDLKRAKRKKIILPGFPGTRTYDRRQNALKKISQYVPAEKDTKVKNRDESSAE